MKKHTIYFLNINGYWDNFKVLLEQFVALEFANKDLLNYFNFFESVEALLPVLLNSFDIDSNE